MTALLILAIGASSVLVFTSRVELLKLAVIVALWAAVASAFVSVIYRRQSDVDQARARDLKLVYDLQLDREISARREYELTVESQLRRELASELRAQAADEVAALRTELSALRTNLEILFDSDLSHRPALETESSGRTTIRAYSDWARTGPEAVTGARPAPAPFYPEDTVTKTSENPIIDVPEVRIPTGAIPVPSTPQPHQAPQPPQAPMGAHRRAADEPQKTAQQPPKPQQPQPNAGRWAQPAQPFVAPEQRREPEPPPPPPQPWVAPAAQAPTPTPAPAPAPKPDPVWKPVEAEGEWLPPGAPGSSWSSATPVGPSRHGESGRHGAKEPDAGIPSRHGRHAGPSASEETGGRRRAESRHSAESAGNHAAPEPPPAPAAEPTPVPAPEAAPEPAPAPRLASPPPAPARHSTGADAGTDGAPSTGGQSVADLLARLQTVPGEGRRRRRRED